MEIPSQRAIVGTVHATRDSSTPQRPPLTGIVPGGGSAHRLAELPFSKELLPIGFQATPHGTRPKLVSEYLLESLGRAGVERLVWVLDRSKTDVVRRFGQRHSSTPPIAYVITDASPSVVHTLDAAYPFVEGQRVVFGFPDIVLEPASCLLRLVERLDRDDADVVLGTFPAPPEQVADRIRPGRDDRIDEVRVKGPGSWPLAWAAAAWAPRFTDFLHAWLSTAEDEKQLSQAIATDRELYLGHAVQAAIESGMRVVGVQFDGGGFLDVGTPSGLAAAAARYGTRLPQ